MGRMKISALFAFATLVISAHGLLADTLTVSRVSSQYGPNCSVSNATGSSCTGGSTVFFVPPLTDTVTFNGTASARASYGSLGTAAQALGSCDIPDHFVNCYLQDVGTSEATASFTDVINLSDAPARGELAFTFQTSGLNTVTCTGVPDGNVCEAGDTQSHLHAPGNSYTSEQFVPLSNGTNSVTIEIGYLGESVPIEFDLSSSATCGQSDFTSCSDMSNFFDTAIVTSLSLFDSNGSLIPDAVFSAASGTDYNALSEPPSAIPEPCSSILLGTGLLILIGFTKIKSSRFVCRV